MFSTSCWCGFLDSYTSALAEGKSLKHSCDHIGSNTLVIMTLRFPMFTAACKACYRLRQHTILQSPANRIHPEVLF